MAESKLLNLSCSVTHFSTVHILCRQLSLCSRNCFQHAEQMEGREADMGSYNHTVFAQLKQLVTIRVCCGPTLNESDQPHFFIKEDITNCYPSSLQETFFGVEYHFKPGRTPEQHQVALPIVLHLISSSAPNQQGS